jgi:exopolysaccharide biosynthesis polyprenyl glycosylphosphotransferase
MMRHYSLRYVLFLYTLDMLVVLGALALSSVLRIRIEFGKFGVPEAFAIPAVLYPLAPLMWLFAYNRANVYGPRQSPGFWHELRNILIGHGMAALIFFGALYISYRDFSRVQAFYFIGLTLAGVVTYRVIARFFYRRFGKAISDLRRVLVIGTGENARQIAGIVRQYEWAGLMFAGYIQLDQSDSHPPTPLLGSLGDLPRLIDQHQINEIIVPLKWFDSHTSERITEMMRLLDSFAVNIRLAPDYSDLAYFQTSAEDFSGIPLIGVRERVFSPAQRLVKRLFDLVFASLFLLLAAPLGLLIALLIRLDSPGPILFAQKRVGEYGRIFTMLKFRTMYTGSDNPESEYGKRRDDPRVTRVGRWLRRASLDELPQFINVLRGEMSLVGPRPELPGLVNRYEWWQRKRFEVPQGLTGWWQINGRSDKPMHQHTEDDLYYIRHYSLWLDIQIILRTALAVIAGKGAF